MIINYKEEYSFIQNGCLNLTDNCNLKCKYCFVEQNPHYMDLQTAKDAVTFFMNNRKKRLEKGLIDYGPCRITLFGGEPTLMWDEIIVPLVEWAPTNEVNFNITTNGTLLNEEKIKWLKEHNIPILLSIDGCKFTQDYNRPCKNGKSSFDMVLKNIPIILKYFPYTTFRATIYEDTVEHTFENYCFAEYCGFKQIYMTPDSRKTKWAPEKLQILKEQIQMIGTKIYNDFQNNRNMIKFNPFINIYKSIIARDIRLILNKKLDLTASRNIERCGLGTYFGSIGYNGNIYACQEQDSLGENNKFFIGNIYTGINTEKHLSLLKEFSQDGIKQECENKEICNENCILRDCCHYFACPSASQSNFNNFFIDSEIHCFYEQQLFLNALTIMRLLTKENNLYFKKYLEKFCNYDEYYLKKE